MPDTNTSQPVRKTLVLPKTRMRQPDTNHFWFVWSPARNRPRQRHASRDAAIAEAERLAQLYPCVEFIAYEARPIRLVEL